MAGTFTILLDWRTNTGQLFAIEDKLVNVELVLGSGAIVPIGSQPEEFAWAVPATPSYREHGIYSQGSVWSEPEFAKARFTYSVGVGRLVSDGRISLLEGGFRQGTPYDITFGLQSATLSLSLPSSFLETYNTTITNAHAVMYDARIAGDLNGDLRVDAADYVMLRKKSASAADLEYWRALFDANTATNSGQPTPEPSALVLLAVGLAASCGRRRR